MSLVLDALKGFGRFWWDFIIGDDWAIAAGVGVGLLATWGVVAAPDVPGWWLLPIAVVAVLVLGVHRANVRG